MSGNDTDCSDNSNYVFIPQDTYRSPEKGHFSMKNKFDATVLDYNMDTRNADIHNTDNDTDSLSLLSSSDTDTSKSQIFRSDRSDSNSSPIYLHNQLKEHLSRHLRPRSVPK